MPVTDDGRRRLAELLADAEVRFARPEPVWCWSVERMREERALLFGFRPGAPRRGIVLRYERVDGEVVDRLEQVCEPFIRERPLQ